MHSLTAERTASWCACIHFTAEATQLNTEISLSFSSEWVAWEKAMLALIQIRTAYLQLAGWPGSEVDSLFLMTWTRTLLLHKPYVLSLVFSWYLFLKAESFMYMKSQQDLLLALVGEVSCVSTRWALSPFKLQHVNTFLQLYRKHCNLKTDACCR